MAQPLFPVFLKLAGRPCLVVGAGNVASSKILSLVEAGAVVTVVAPHASPEIEHLANDGTIRWASRIFLPGDLDGVFLAIAATSDPTVNLLVFLESRQRGVLCNSVDDPPHCEFYFPAVVRRGDLQFAISTAGESPALSQRLRIELDESLDDGLGDWLREIGERRREILASEPPSEARKLRLRGLASRESWEAWQAQKSSKQECVRENSAPVLVAR
ncbi:MAG TPA: bifunctional precorrin-2 dehydrogenase/sirohydrochlorin ferrochelatase [Candidatus Acidoferrum sp.]|nr:bifunctional precorrin-2 dehydrogenase/sirohydrochlorin ferrochelatase [Candidatus Acidoferrum sp.]